MCKDSYLSDNKELKHKNFTLSCFIENFFCLLTVLHASICKTATQDFCRTCVVDKFGESLQMKQNETRKCDLHDSMFLHTFTPKLIIQSYNIYEQVQIHRHGYTA